MTHEITGSVTWNFTLTSRYITLVSAPCAPVTTSCLIRLCLCVYHKELEGRYVADTEQLKAAVDALRQQLAHNATVDSSSADSTG